MKFDLRNYSPFLFLLYIIIYISSPVLAQDISGEIININNQQHAVFIDLGEGSIYQGDIFVVESGGKKIFLEAADVKRAVSRLMLSQKANFQSDPSDFDGISIGSKIVRVFSEKSPVSSQSGATLDGMPTIDPQMMIKPNIATESIQGLDNRLDKMVESNVKLFNSLTELLNEKKQWQVTLEGLRTELQAAQHKVTELNSLNAELNAGVAERDTLKKQYEDAQSKIKALKERLDHLTILASENLK